MSSPKTRDVIAKAAITLFLEKGYQETSIADIRATSGATTGSIYHFFGNKAGVAVAIWEDAISGWKQAFEAIDPGAEAEAQIRATVESLLIWGRGNAAHFAVYDEIAFLSRTIPDFQRIVARIDEGHAVSSRMYLDWVEAGAVADLPWPLARALMMGPGLEALRSGAALDDPTIARLSAVAWAAVRPGAAYQ